MARSNRRSAREFAGLVLVGVLAGALVGQLVFFYEWVFNTRYTARIPFQIVPPPPQSIESMGNGTAPLQREDWEVVLHRQEFLFKQESFLERVLESPEFHEPDAGGPRETPWLAEHKAALMTALQHDLRVEPAIDAAAFSVTMTTRDPKEAAELVTAAVKVYEQFTAEHEQVARARQVANIDQAVKTLEVQFANDSDALKAWGRGHAMDVANTRYEVERAAVQSVAGESFKASQAAQLAQAQFKAAQARQSNGKGMDLPPDVVLSLENDPTLRSLTQARYTAQQEIAVENAHSAPDRVHLGDLLVRNDVLSQQIRAERERKGNLLTQVDLAILSRDAADKVAQANNYLNGISAQMASVLTLGDTLFDYQHRMDDLKQEETLLLRARQQDESAKAMQSFDAPRIEALAANALPPEEPSEPRWFWFAPFGAGGGLLLTAMGALLLDFARFRQRRSIERDLIEPELPEAPRGEPTGNPGENQPPPSPSGM